MQPHNALMKIFRVWACISVNIQKVWTWLDRFDWHCSRWCKYYVQGTDKQSAKCNIVYKPASTYHQHLLSVAILQGYGNKHTQAYQSYFYCFNDQVKNFKVSNSMLIPNCLREKACYQHCHHTSVLEPSSSNFFHIVTSAKTLYKSKKQLKWLV